MRDFTHFWINEWTGLTAFLLSMFMCITTTLFLIPDKIHIERPVFVLIGITLIFLTIEFGRRRFSNLYDPD